MKCRLILSIGALLLFTGIKANPDSLGLPGDNLDLCGVLELFKKATSPEAFEKALNQKDNKVNNLDLNGDGKVDYIRVVDHTKDNAHAIVLQVPVNGSEAQDVAVIEIEKKGDKSAQLQIVGDEALYGKDYIIEPKTDKEAPSPDGKWKGFAKMQVVIVDVWYWPCVQYIWYPGYVVYVSPWYYGYWPGWWYPWGPYPYYVYYGYMYPYHDYYYWTDDYRNNTAQTVYAPRRTVSPTVQRQTETARADLSARQKTVKRDGQQPVPGQRPTTGATHTQDGQQPRGNDANTPPSPQQQPRDQKPQEPRGGQQTTPPPPPSPRGGNPPQSPPQPRPNVQPTPQPRPQPSPQPRPQPSPRPRPR